MAGTRGTAGGGGAGSGHGRDGQQRTADGAGRGGAGWGGGVGKMLTPTQVSELRLKCARAGTLWLWLLLRRGTGRLGAGCAWAGACGVRSGCASCAAGGGARIWGEKNRTPAAVHLPPPCELCGFSGLCTALQRAHHRSSPTAPVPTSRISPPCSVLSAPVAAAAHMPPRTLGSDSNSGRLRRNIAFRRPLDSAWRRTY